MRTEHIFVIGAAAKLMGRLRESKTSLRSQVVYLLVRASTRKPVWMQKGQRNNRHDFYSKVASREMPGTEHDLC